MTYSAAYDNLLKSDNKQQCSYDLKTICSALKINGKRFTDDYDSEQFLWRLVDPEDFVRRYRNDQYFVPLFERLHWLLAAGHTPEEFGKKGYL